MVRSRACRRRAGAPSRACRRRTATTTVSPSTSWTTVAERWCRPWMRPPAYQPHPTLPSRAATIAHTGTIRRPRTTARERAIAANASASIRVIRQASPLLGFSGHARPAPAAFPSSCVVALDRRACLPRLHRRGPTSDDARTNVDTHVGRRGARRSTPRYDAARHGQQRREGHARAGRRSRQGRRRRRSRTG